MCIRDRLLAVQQRSRLGRELEHRVPCDVLREVAAVDELADEALPVFAAHLGADAVGAELVVPEAQDLLVLGAAQDVDDVRDAEALAQPVHAACLLYTSP